MIRNGVAPRSVPSAGRSVRVDQRNAPSNPDMEQRLDVMRRAALRRRVEVETRRDDSQRNPIANVPRTTETGGTRTIRLDGKNVKRRNDVVIRFGGGGGSNPSRTPDAKTITIGPRTESGPGRGTPPSVDVVGGGSSGGAAVPRAALPIVKNGAGSPPRGGNALGPNIARRVGPKTGSPPSTGNPRGPRTSPTSPIDTRRTGDGPRGKKAGDGLATPGSMSGPALGFGGPGNPGGPGGGVPGGGGGGGGGEIIDGDGQTAQSSRGRRGRRHGSRHDRGYDDGYHGGGFQFCSTCQTYQVVHTSCWHGYGYDSYGYDCYDSGYGYGGYGGYGCWGGLSRWGGLGYGFGSGLTYWSPWRRYSLNYLSCWPTYTYSRPFYSASWLPGGTSHGIYDQRPYFAWWLDPAYANTGPYGYGGYAGTTSTPAYDPWAQDGSLPLEGEEVVLLSLEDGWAAVAFDDLARAVEAFGQLVLADDGDADARVGLAVTSALLENDAVAFAMMRQALRLDPTALDRVPDTESVVADLHTLVERYGQRVKLNLTDTDALFMTAAIRYVLDDDAVAFFAIDAAIRNGDDDQAALNLRKRLEERMYNAL